MLEPKDLKQVASLTPEEVEQFIHLLKQFKDVFAQPHRNIHGTTLEITKHKLPLYLDMKHVNYKLQKLNPKWAIKIKGVKRTTIYCFPKRS